MAQKLSAKGHEKQDIELVIDELSQTGFVSDKRFAESFIHWRRNRGYGPLRIRAELQAKGLDKACIAERLEITDNAWNICARKIWQKQFKDKMPTDFATRAKQMRFLQYRGFTREQIESVFSLSNEAEVDEAKG